MHEDVENTLTRELRQVADGLGVPPLPLLPSGPPQRPRWAPTLAAAAVALIVLVTLVGVLSNRGGTPSRPRSRPR